MTDRIGEVKKIHEEFEEKWDKLLDTLPDCSGRIEFEHDKLRQEYYREICQLFPQPLDDKELEKEIEDILRRLGNFEAGYDGDLDEIDRDEALAKILALLQQKCKECEYDPQAAEFGFFLEHGWTPPAELQPKIEEARKAGFDDGVKKTTVAMDSTIDAQLEEARKQERERILANLPVNPWIGRERGCNPDKRVAVDIILDKVRQALKGGEPDES